MQRDRGVTKSRLLSYGLLDDATSRSTESNGYATIPIYSSFGANCIEHRVTKLDTLAGVAVKYGVEVADIKRMNGLVTDIQMFAHKSLQIPLPGRHPPSPIISNESAQNGANTPPRPSNYISGSLQSHKLRPPPFRLSPAMRSLQGFYGLTQPNNVPSSEGTEMATYKAGKNLIFKDHIFSESQTSEPIRSPHRKSRSLVNFLALEYGGDVTDEPERPIRGHQMANPERTPEILLKEDITGGTTFSGRAGKGLALRSKPGNNRPDPDTPLSTDEFVLVRKSSSTSNLSESGTSRWSLKPEAVARPIFDGLPKPISGRRNKAALD